MLESSSESSTSEYFDDASLDAVNTIRRRRKKKKRTTEENSENEVSISSSLETIIPKNPSQNEISKNLKERELNFLNDDSKQDDDILPTDLLEQSMTESPTNEDFNMDEFLVHKTTEENLIKSESQIPIVNEPIADELNDQTKISTPLLSDVGSIDYNTEYFNNFDDQSIVKDEFIVASSLEDQLNNIAAENIQKDEEDERNDLDDDSEIEDQDERHSDDLDDFNDKEIDRLLDFTALESKRTAGEQQKTDSTKHSKPAKKKKKVLDIIEDVGKEETDDSSSEVSCFLF